MEKAGSETFVVPSDTLMMMFDHLPTVVGFATTAPVIWSKFNHVGLFAIEKRNESPSASLALGRKLYQLPALTEVVGVPEITGAAAIANEATEKSAAPASAREYKDRPSERLGMFNSAKAQKIPGSRSFARAAPTRVKPREDLR
jgi:hypothetical protein